MCRKGKVRLAQPTSSGRRAPGTAGGWGHAARGGWSQQLWSGPPSSLSVSAERLRLCSHWSKPRYKCILLSPQPRFPDRPVLSLAKWTAAKQDQRFRFQLVTSSRPPHTTHSFILSRTLNQNPACCWVPGLLHWPPGPRFSHMSCDSGVSMTTKVTVN